MSNQNALQKILHFFLTKIIIGIVVVAGSVAFTEWLGRLILDRISINSEIKNFIVGIAEAGIALLSYILLFRAYEKRAITELQLSTFGKHALPGFLIGLLIQSLLILVIYVYGGYTIEKVNPVSSIIPVFSIAISAGFVAEIIIRGIIFRVTEEKAGTVIALIILTIVFALMHFNVKGATTVSIIATAIQAGFLLSAAYVYTRSLWFTIFFHFAWDLTEPGIYGAINPGNTIENSILQSRITGPQLITGGSLGPENSIQAILFCLATALLFLWLAKRKKHFK